jgi:hypothetical protein
MKINVLMYKTLPLIKVKLFGTIKAEELACVAGGIRGHERMGSLKYRLPKNDTF